MTVAVHGDARTVLQHLIPKVKNAEHPEWLATFDRPAQIEFEKVVKREVYPESGRMNMGEVVNKVSEATGT